MNPRTLSQFLALSQSLHFGRASSASNISLSALSRNIRQLEEELGVTLFDRDNRSVSLTAEGKLFEPYARDALAGWNRIRHTLADTTNDLRGEISLYCSVTASHSFLFELLNRFRQHYPGIEIKLHTGDPDHAIDRVLAANEDVSIAAHPTHVSRALVFKLLAVSPLLFIAPVDLIDSDIPTTPPQAPTEWAKVPMILAEGGLARSRVDAWFRAHRITPRVYAQVAGNEAIVSMVSLGLGVGVVPKIVLDNSPLVRRVRVLDIQPQLQPYDVGLFTLSKSLKNPLVNAFWSLVTESAAKA